MLIGLTQLGARCSDGSCQAQEDLIAGFSAIEAEAELIQVRLKLCAAAVISAEQERFQVADGFVQPTQVAGFVLFCVQLHARQVLTLQNRVIAGAFLCAFFQFSLDRYSLSHYTSNL